MIIIGLLWLMGLMALIFLVIGICTHDYTKKDGKDIKENIDDHLLR